MELAPECQLYCCSLGTSIIRNLKVFASLPTRSTQEIALRGLTRLPDFPFLWPGSHLKSCFMVTTSFRGQITCLCMQAVIQDPFPRRWILKHKAFTVFLEFRIGILILE